MLAFALLALAAPTPQEPCALDPFFSPSLDVDDRFGEVLCLDGDRMLVSACGWSGTFLRQGAVYLYEWNGVDWIETAFLTASDPQETARFGSSIAIEGDMIVVGAREVNAAYTFELVGGVWTETQRITSSHFGTTNYMFGWGMDLDGDWLLIGDPLDLANGIASGAAFLFERSGGAWVERQVLIPRDIDVGDWFGFNVCIEGDRLVVSSHQRDAAVNGEGAVYVFERTGGPFVETALLEAGEGVGGLFGFDLDLQGDQVAIGALRAENGGISSGAAYLYEGAGTSWNQVQRFAASDAELDDFYGYSVRLEGERLLVAAPLDDIGFTNSGTVYWYSSTGTSWTYSGRWSSELPGSAVLGIDVELSDDRIIASTEITVPESLSGFVTTFESPATIVPYCFAGPCPCGNVDEFGSCTNSTGVGATLSGCGTSSLGSDDMVLRAEGIPANQFGILFMGGMPASTVLGDGVRCVGGSLFRYPAQNSGAGGTFTEGPGVAAFASANFPQSGQIVSGSTWYFGAWYRDPFGPCGTGNNMTNGVRVTFTP